VSYTVQRTLKPTAQQLAIVPAKRLASGNSFSQIASLQAPEWAHSHINASWVPQDPLNSSRTLADAGMRNFAISFLFKREALCSRNRAVLVQTGYL
jgi:hypothetical protein